MSVMRLLLLTVRVHKADEVSEVRLWERLMSWMRWVWLIMKRLLRSERLMSDIVLDEDCEVNKSDKVK